MHWKLLSSARLAEHAAEWDALQAATTATPFLESRFLLPLLAEFGTGHALLALLRDGQRLVAAALVQPAGRGVWQTFQPSQLPLGPWLSAADADLQGLMRGLLAALPGVSFGLGLTQLDTHLHPCPPATRDLRLQDYIRTSSIEIAGSFDDYWEARGKNLRQNTRKQRNKLAADGVEPRLECITDPAGVAAAMADYGALESRGWKAGGGTAIHPDNAQGRFYRTMLENFCSAGHGRIYRYCFGDQVVSMDLCIDQGATVVILKTAYDESLRTVSPSTLMRQDQFRAWWDEGRYRRIEFYGKTMEWHTRWTADERALYHATVYRWSWLRDLHERLRQRRSGSTAPDAVAVTE